MAADLMLGFEKTGETLLLVALCAGSGVDRIGRQGTVKGLVEAWEKH